MASSSRASLRQRLQPPRDRRGEQTGTLDRCSHQPGAPSLPPKVRGRSRIPTCAAHRTNAVRHHDDSGVRRRHATTTIARARGARRSRSRGAKVPHRGQGAATAARARGCLHAASALAVRHSDDGSRTCVSDDDGSCVTVTTAAWRRRFRHIVIDRSMSMSLSYFRSSCREGGVHVGVVSYKGSSPSGTSTSPDVAPVPPLPCMLE